MPVYPANDLYPSDTLFPKPTEYYLTVEYTEDDVVQEETIQLPFDCLTYLDETYDEFIIDGEGNASKIKRIGFSSTGQKYVLPEEQTISYGQILIQLHEGVNTLSLNYYTPTVYLKYAVQSDLTDAFATKVELNTSINQTTDSIMLEVNKKVDDEEFGTMITQNVDSVQVAWNQIGENVKIEADQGQAELNIYDEDSNLLMSLNKSGQEFYRETKNIGSIGLRTIQVENDNGNIDNYYGIVNYINSVNDNNGDGSFIEWTEQITNETGTDVSGTILGFYGTNFLTGQDKRIVANFPLYANSLRTTSIKASQSNVQFLDVNDNLLAELYTNTFLFYKSPYIRYNYMGGDGYEGQSIASPMSSSGTASKQVSFIYYNNITGSNAFLIAGGPNFSGDDFPNKNYVDTIYSSDANLKKNIVPTNKKALNDISKIKLKQFDWKENDVHTNIGFIAQQLEEIDDSYVNKTFYRDRETNEEKDMLVLNLKSLIALAIKGIQEQQEEIEELRNQIKELKENGKN